MNCGTMALRRRSSQLALDNQSLRSQLYIRRLVKDDKLSDADKKIRELRMKYSNLLGKNIKLTKKNLILSDKSKKDKKNKKLLDRRIQNLSKEKNGLYGMNENWKSKYNRSKQEADSIREENEELKRKNGSVKSKNEVLVGQNKELVEKFQRISRKYIDLGEKSREEVSQLTKRNEKLSDAMKLLAGKFSSLKKVAISIREENKQLKKRL